MERECRETASDSRRVEGMRDGSSYRRYPARARGDWASLASVQTIMGVCPEQATLQTASTKLDEVRPTGYAVAVLTAP